MHPQKVILPACRSNWSLNLVASYRSYTDAIKLLISTRYCTPVSSHCCLVRFNLFFFFIILVYLTTLVIPPSPCHVLFCLP